MILLIDGDQYLQRCCAATERETKWDEDNWVLASNEEEAWDTLQGALRDVFAHFGTKEHVMCLGESPYFRHKLFPAYKAGRGRKPLAFHALRERLKNEYRCAEFPGLEADDVMGIMATKPNTDAVIVARDKDMRGVPAKVWDGRDFRNISQSEADYWHLFQTLTGDVTDGYKGCPGIGPKKAESILKGTADWDAVERAFVRVHQKDVKDWEMNLQDGEVTRWEAAADRGKYDALLNARLARILRWSDWDRTKKEPILWHPGSLPSSV